MTRGLASHLRSLEPDRQALLLRRAASRPLPNWREVYESVSPVDLKTGERRPRVPPPGSHPRRAAVLVPVLLDRQGPRLVYTVRRDHLPDHAGQISFPGGGMEAGDGSPRETALREAHEEIALDPSLVEIAGRLEELYIHVSNFLVTPFVGLLPEDTGLVLAPDEVEEIFAAPIEELIAPGTFRVVVRKLGDTEVGVPVFSAAGHDIWGATAAITAGLLARLGWEGYRDPAR
ncbi:putative Nudix hydrolase NudL [Rubrobacter xylanophilus DSM 9941]|uniref:NUDIX hydrolase n=1 Tax=Rubrobacter xylanophilus TaxID=49319 RepID=UPI001C63DA4B|nr:CoA pyrophosphatase [Rubrobacter xylanophilus]QYJ14451.1 putative Nudix hydrolase NudL [Rubrobacter xylanophilus DSM 9941]